MVLIRKEKKSDCKKMYRIKEVKSPEDMLIHTNICQN